MPDISGTYWKHPISGGPGYWIDTGKGIIGVSATQINDLVPTGAPKTRPARFRQNLINTLQPQLEQRTPLSNWSPEDQAWLIANPAPFCRVEGGFYVAQISLVDVEVYSLSPLRFNVTISDGASSSQTKYG